MRRARSCPGLENRLLRQGDSLRWHVAGTLFVNLFKTTSTMAKKLFWGVFGYPFGSSFWVPRRTFGVPSGKLRIQPLFTFFGYPELPCI